MHRAEVADVFHDVAATTRILILRSQVKSLSPGDSHLYPCKHKYNKSVNLLNCRPFLYVVGVSVHGNLGEKRRVSENQKSNVVCKDIKASLPVRGS